MASSFRFFRHFDYGLRREVPDSLQYDKLQGDHWRQIQMNPFTASMAPIGEVAARELIGHGDLNAPAAMYETRSGKVIPMAEANAAHEASPGRA